MNREIAGLARLGNPTARLTSLVTSGEHVRRRNNRGVKSGGREGFKIHSPALHYPVLHCPVLHCLECTVQITQSRIAQSRTAQSRIKASPVRKTNRVLRGSGRPECMEFRFFSSPK